MRRWSGGCALVALILSWNISAAVGAERINLWAEDHAPASEGLIDLSGGSFLSLVSHEEDADYAWDADCDFCDDPNWTVWVGAIFLQRENPGNQTLFTAAGFGLLNASDLNFGTQAGPDINAIRHGDVFDVGFRYFHVHNMSANRRLFPPGAGNLNLGTPFPVNAPEIGLAYTTNIQSVELNLRKNLTSNLTVLAGFRYLSLNDNLGLNFDITGDAFSLFTLHTFGINRLYGGQAGVDANVWTSGRFQFQTAFKAGVYGNDARNSIRLRELSILDTSIGTREMQTAFVGDWNFTGVVQLTDVWAIRGGYQLLWLSGVALASEQFPLSDLLAPGIRIDTAGDLFLHGALISLQAGW